jgi:hypothetical protein
MTINWLESVSFEFFVSFRMGTVLAGTKMTTPGVPVPDLLLFRFQDLCHFFFIKLCSLQTFLTEFLLKSLNYYVNQSFMFIFFY